MRKKRKFKAVKKPLSPARLAHLREASKKGVEAMKRNKESRAAVEITAPEGTWEHEVQRFGKGFSAWRARIKRQRGFDPAGFLEQILKGKFEVNAETISGQGEIGITTFKPRKPQLQWFRDIIEWRWAATDDDRWRFLQTQDPNAVRPEGRFANLVIKYRRAGFSTGNVQFINAEGTVNRGCNAVIAAHSNDGLDNMSDILRTCVGGSKTVEEEVEETITNEDGTEEKITRSKTVRKAKGMSMKRFKTINDSVIRLLGPNASMGRGWNPMHLQWTETDYVDDIEPSLDSVLPSLNKSAFSTVTLESTMRRDATTGFKDYVARSQRGETKAKVYFQGWMDDETAVLPPTADKLGDLLARRSLAGAENYEFEVLMDKYHATIEQVNWWRSRFVEDARNNLAAMKEMYPATLEEALEASGGTEFLTADAMDFQRSNCCGPIERRLCRYDTFDEILDANVWLNNPHLAIWEQPRVGHKYVVGADGADAAMRQVFEEGSECYAVVLDETTGEQVAEWHGHANAADFAIAIWRAHKYYNHALVVPEKNACAAVIAYLMDTLQCNNVYERESFGAVIEKFAGTYGFDTRAQSRPILVQRLQDNVNRKTILLHSRMLVDQLDNFGKRRGRPNKAMMRKGAACDDGPIALGLCMFGHSHAIDGAWQPRDLIDLATAPIVRIDNTERAKLARGEIDNMDDWDEDDRLEEGRRILGMT